MTTADLLEQCATILQDPDGVRFGAPLLTAHMNTVQRDFVSRTGLLATIGSLSLDTTQTPATCFYAAPVDLLELKGVTAAGVRLGRVTEDDCPDDFETRGGASDSYLFGEYGPSLVRLYPDPGGAVAVRCSYLRTPSDLATNDPEIPATWQMALVYGAVALCYLADSETEEQAKAANYQQLYEGLVGDCMTRSSRKLDASTRRPPFHAF
jgi:hypothetical protein